MKTLEDMTTINTHSPEETLPGLSPEQVDEAFAALVMEIDGSITPEEEVLLDREPTSKHIDSYADGGKIRR